MCNIQKTQANVNNNKVVIINIKPIGQLRSHFGVEIKVFFCYHWSGCIKEKKIKSIKKRKNKKQERASSFHFF